MARVMTRAGVRRLLPGWWQPARIVMGAFAGAVLLGTALLMLPLARQAGGAADFVTALFTATSAVCVTGLIVVDTPGYWSSFGELVILALIQVGGLGIMTLASLLGLLISRRLGMRMRRSAQSETKSLGIGDVKRVTLTRSCIRICGSCQRPYQHPNWVEFAFGGIN